MLCPHCYKDAPIVYRGVSAHCTACGGLRTPLANESVNLAGQGSKVGGTVASVFGWIVLVGGVVLGGSVTAFFQWLMEGGYIGWLLGTPIMVLSAIFAATLLFSGKKLAKSGQAVQRSAQEKAILGIAENKGGVISAIDVSRSLDLTLQQADALLTRMAKETPDQVTVDLDDHGGVFYRFPQVQFEKLPREGANGRSRVAVAPPPRQRVAGEAWAGDEDEVEDVGAARRKAL